MYPLRCMTKGIRTNAIHYIFQRINCLRWLLLLFCEKQFALSRLYAFIIQRARQFINISIPFIWNGMLHVVQYSLLLRKHPTSFRMPPSKPLCVASALSIKPCCLLPWLWLWLRKRNTLSQEIDRHGQRPALPRKWPMSNRAYASQFQG